MDVNEIFINKTKSDENEGVPGTQTKSHISCLPRAVENLKWHQFIGRTLFMAKCLDI